MGTDPAAGRYFPFDVQIAKQIWEKLRLENVRGMYHGGNVPPIVFYRVISRRMSQLPENAGKWVQPGQINMYALLTRIFRHVLDRYEEQSPGVLEDALERGEIPYPSSVFRDTAGRFVELFPPVEVLDGGETASSFLFNDPPPHLRKKKVVHELILLSLAAENPAIDTFRQLVDDRELAASSPYRRVIAVLDVELAKAPTVERFGMSILELLRAPLKASPDSLRGQVQFIRSKWGSILPPDLLADIMTSFDVVTEEEREWWGTPGPPVVPEFDLLGGRTGAGYEYPEYERFSPDADWMSNVVLIAKMVYVWLDQLSKKYGRPLNRLDEIPDEELDSLQRWGFTALWLIGIWERSPSSQKIKHLMGNHDAVASAYSLYDYVIAADLGGDAALDSLRERCRRRGIRLSADMVPNHTGIYSKWVQEHPDWFVQVDYPPYPGYNFTGPDLSFASHLTVQIEDGYWNKSDAAVVFKHIDHHSGRVRYIYHGNDGTSTPWNDTAQLNYLIPEVREAVIQTILHVARKFPIIRFDAAMTLAKKHYQRLWFPQPGGGGGVPSRAEHAMTREQFDAAFPEEFWREVVDRVAREVPDTLLLAEAFWLMEGYFVRTLGMHRVYNSAFMNMLKMEENAKYRQTVKNVLEFNPGILKRFVNFMNNPDERTAIEQFGKEGKYIGAAVLLVTMPGLPMIGHGQIEGFKEKYGMEYRRAYWEEEPDQHLIRMHEEKIFPLMRRRYLFSGSENFVFYDFFSDGHVDENVFAYSNRFLGERGVILYHNKWGNTSGWIRTSTGIAGKADGEEAVIRQTTLGDALSFKADGRHYYAFRDYSSGLEYLRHGIELAEKGMYVELGAYEYHAFLDFREIYDDEYGNWGKLCFELSNQPVANLAEEFVQVQYRHILSPCRDLFTAMVERLDQVFDPKAPAAVRGEAVAFCREGFEEFFTIFSETTGTKEDPAVAAAQTAASIGIVERLSRLKSRQAAVRAVLEELREMLESDVNRLVVFSAFAMKGAAVIAGTAEEDAAFYDRFGFRRIIQENVQTLVERGEVSTFPWGEVRDPLLVKILIAHASFFTEWKEAERGARVADLLADPSVREFLLIHWSAGVEWFSKERFEGLMQWLWVMALAPAAETTAEDEELILQATLLFKTVRELAEVAADAHYRTDDLEALLAAV